jgi:hypothetical protein
MELFAIKADPTFLKPLFERSDSQTTIVNQQTIVNIQLDELPTELIIMICMSSGFHACMQLRKTSTRLRQILNDKRNWSQFSHRSPDVIETKVTMETRMHQFDQLIFAEWPMRGQLVPCVIHRTFLEQYSFLGGISISSNTNGKVKAEFFDNKESLPCYGSAFSQRASSSPLLGGVFAHSCPECEHYDKQTILKTEFVHKALTFGEDLSYEYRLNSKQIVHVSIQEFQGVFGYSSDVPSITVQISKVNGKKLNRFELGWYLKYIAM